MKPEFICEPAMRHHVQRVFAGEYTVDLSPDLDKPRVIDIGANLGSFAIWATLRWPGCSLVCFEPHPKTFKMLCKNVMPWPITDCRAEAVTGLDQPWTELYDGGPNCGCASVTLGVEQLGTCHKVKNIHASKLPPCDVLKIDAEGVELEVLRAYPHLDACQLVLLEAHGSSDRVKLLELFEAKDFRCVKDEQTMPERWTMGWRKE